MNFERHIKFLISFYIAIMVIALPFFTGDNLMNGIQSGKSFAFFYAMLGLLGLMAFALPFIKLQIRFTLIDGLLLLLVMWITINKYLVHEIHCLSLSYFEMLGMVVLYMAIRFFAHKHIIVLLVAICISGAAQAIYGNLQLWGYYPSHHGLFKMTGSFFNPGPYAGYLCGILPVAVGLYWMAREHREHGEDTEEHKDRFKFQVTGFKFTLVGGQPETSNLNRRSTERSAVKPVTCNLKPETCNLNQRSTERSVVKPETCNLKLVT